MSRFSFGETPVELIRKACKEQCPNGYNMTIRSQSEWAEIAKAVNAGIDSHLEAITERSKFDASTGECLIHPDELHTFLRRLYESGNEEMWSLRSVILDTLEIEEV